jgi:hypothetical protein
MEAVNTMTFSQMVALEPRLGELRERARVLWLRHMTPTGINRAWYLDLKPTMLKCVGFGAAVPELRNCQSYDFVYGVLYNVLITGRGKLKCF